MTTGTETEVAGETKVAGTGTGTGIGEGVQTGDREGAIGVTVKIAIEIDGGKEFDRSVDRRRSHEIAAIVIETGAGTETETGMTVEIVARVTVAAEIGTETGTGTGTETLEVAAWRGETIGTELEETTRGVATGTEIEIGTEIGKGIGIGTETVRSVEEKEHRKNVQHEKKKSTGMKRKPLQNLLRVIAKYLLLKRQRAAPQMKQSSKRPLVRRMLERR